MAKLEAADGMRELTCEPASKAAGGSCRLLPLVYLCLRDVDL